MDIPVVAMVLRSGWVARIILLLLAFLSVATWTIIFGRWTFLSSVSSRNREFMRKFQSTGAIADLEKVEKKFEKCPMALIGSVCAGEYRRILSDARDDSGVKDWSFYLQNQFDMASERINSSIADITAGLDHGLVLMAITSSIAPFLGLLGTVWGIMNSFYQIGNQGSASLPVVAPGIAEALITTIVGLGVAIPALFFYNLLMHRAGRVEDEIDSFGEQLLLRLKRDIFSFLFGKENGGRQGRQSPV